LACKRQTMERRRGNQGKVSARFNFSQALSQWSNNVGSDYSGTPTCAHALGTVLPAPNRLVPEDFWVNTFVEPCFSIRLVVLEEV
jgi:hypothetical protein